MSLGLSTSSAQTPQTGFSILKKYTEMKQIGGGAYSTVYKSECRTTQKSVAIKIVDTDLEDGLSAVVMREISLLKELRHPNIIALIECEGIETRTALVLEHCPCDLETLMTQRRMTGRPLHRDPDQIRTFMVQLLQGIAHCHANKVLHRDLKPQNLLIDKHGVLKIADFGLARQVGFHPESENMKGVVVTLWYRAPELLQPRTTTPPYGAAIDVWSCGCILAEMVVDRAIFCGAWDDRSLLQYIQSIPKCGVQAFLNMYHPHQLGHWPPHAVNLLHWMLQYDVKARITAAKALGHPYARDATPTRNLAPLDAFNIRPVQQGQTAGLQQLLQGVPHMPNRPPDGRIQPGSVRATGHGQTGKPYKVQDASYGGGVSSFRT
ncbi:Negative regulator of the PHO system [Trametes pubescens]|uniref:Negative regulator of the PHO system n=1 Tax=Trametes pubescens TaxID=154538 RepID=A0A1M2VQ74_TRAPU|nr:Negative regulator of the PHO system [Trametes pubescens]